MQFLPRSRIIVYLRMHEANCRLQKTLSQLSKTKNMVHNGNFQKKTLIFERVRIYCVCLKRKRSVSDTDK